MNTWLSVDFIGTNSDVSRTEGIEQWYTLIDPSNNSIFIDIYLGHVTHLWVIIGHHLFY